MITCIICRFDTGLSDIVVSGPVGCDACLRRYGPENGTARSMQALQRTLMAVLAELGPA